MAKIGIIVPFILSWEGGFANDPDDTGGATNRGVTIGTFRQMFGKDKTVDELKRMTESHWTAVLKKLFWDKWQADRIESQAVANMLVDWSWHSGVYGIKIPQRVLGVAVDGIVGEKTLYAVNKAGPHDLFDMLKRERKVFFERQAKVSPVKRKYLKGWLNRVDHMGYDRLVCGNGEVIVW